MGKTIFYTLSGVIVGTIVTFVPWPLKWVYLLSFLGFKIPIVWATVVEIIINAIIFVAIALVVSSKLSKKNTPSGSGL